MSIKLLAIFSVSSYAYSQVLLEYDGIGINTNSIVSSLAINSEGSSLATVYLKGGNIIPSSRVMHVEMTETLGAFGSWNYGIVINGLTESSPTRAVGINSVVLKSHPSSEGRTYGVYGVAGNATPGSNYGVFGRLLGDNSGTAILGYDGVTYSNWSQVMPSGVSFAGYFYGKGFFKDQVGFGTNDPKASVHVSNGDIYVEGSYNGIILDSGSSCFRITVDSSGNLNTTAVSCP